MSQTQVKFRLVEWALLGIVLLGAAGMATAAAQPTVEQQRDLLFDNGSALRDKIIRELESAQSIRTTPREALLRNRIVHSEQTWSRLMQEFLAYDRHVSDFVQMLATAQNIQTPQGVQPITLNAQFQFALYSSQLSTHRETIRSILRDFSELVSSRRAEANALLALMVSVASIFVALFLGIVSLMAR